MKNDRPLPHLPSWHPLGDGRELKSKTFSPLFTLLTQINIAAQNGLDLLAISMAVALPDICSSLISDDGRTDRNRYKAWCAANLKDGFTYITPDDMYSMRCGVLHNGRFGDLSHNVARVIFIPGGGSMFSDGKVDDAYMYSVMTFCLNINRAVVAWYEENQSNPTVVENISRLMQYREGGFPPYFSGRTVVA